MVTTRSTSRRNGNAASAATRAVVQAPRPTRQGLRSQSNTPLVTPRNDPENLLKEARRRAEYTGNSNHLFERLKQRNESYRQRQRNRNNSHVNERRRRRARQRWGIRSRRRPQLRLNSTIQPQTWQYNPNRPTFNNQRQALNQDMMDIVLSFVSKQDIESLALVNRYFQDQAFTSMWKSVSFKLDLFPHRGRYWEPFAVKLARRLVPPPHPPRRRELTIPSNISRQQADMIRNIRLEPERPFLQAAEPWDIDPIFRRLPTNIQRLELHLPLSLVKFERLTNLDAMASLRLSCLKYPTAIGAQLPLVRYIPDLLLKRLLETDTLKYLQLEQAEQLNTQNFNTTIGGLNLERLEIEHLDIRQTRANATQGIVQLMLSCKKLRSVHLRYNHDNDVDPNDPLDQLACTDLLRRTLASCPYLTKLTIYNEPSVHNSQPDQMGNRFFDLNRLSSLTHLAVPLKPFVQGRHHRALPRSIQFIQLQYTPRHNDYRGLDIGLRRLIDQVLGDLTDHGGNYSSLREVILWYQPETLCPPDDMWMENQLQELRAPIVQLFERESRRSAQRIRQQDPALHARRGSDPHRAVRVRWVEEAEMEWTPLGLDLPAYEWRDGGICRRPYATDDEETRCPVPNTADHPQVRRRRLPHPQRSIYGKMCAMLGPDRFYRDRWLEFHLLGWEGEDVHA